MNLFPEGLTRDQFRVLSECVQRTEGASIDAIWAQALRKLDHVRAAHTRNKFVNLPVAEAICGVIGTVCERWDAIPEHAVPWCRGMIGYFARGDDEEPDLASPVGFDDDAEVLNACLRLAGLEEHRVNPEDYDNAQ